MSIEVDNKPGVKFSNDKKVDTPEIPKVIVSTDASYEELFPHQVAEDNGATLDILGVELQLYDDNRAAGALQRVLKNEYDGDLETLGDVDMVFLLAYAHCEKARRNLPKNKKIDRSLALKIRSMKFDTWMDLCPEFSVCAEAIAKMKGRNLAELSEEEEGNEEGSILTNTST